MSQLERSEMESGVLPLLVRDPSRVEGLTRRRFDAIIVGGGIQGATLAREASAGFCSRVADPSNWARGLRLADHAEQPPHPARRLEIPANPRRIQAPRLGSGASLVPVAIPRFDEASLLSHAPVQPGPRTCSSAA